MLIVSVNNGAIYMDGHNAAQYHQLLGGSSFAIYHFSKAYTYAAPGYDGHLEVFSRGNDNNIWHAGETAPNSTSWNRNSPILSGSAFNGDPAVGIYRGTLQLFARGTDNNIQHLGQTAPNGGWDPHWQALEGKFAFQGTPAVADDANGNIEVFARGTDNNMWHIVYSNSSWGMWTPLVQGSAFNGDPAVGIYQGTLQLFARGTDNNIQHLGQTAPNGGWDPHWQALEGKFAFQGTPAVADDANGNIEVFARGTDNNMWHNAYLPGWNGWKPL
jgi:acylphosphatase